MKLSDWHFTPSIPAVALCIMVSSLILAGCAFDKLRLSIDHGRADVSNIVTNAVRSAKALSP